MSVNLTTPTNVMPKGSRKGWILIILSTLIAYGLYNILPYDENANKGLALLIFIGILWLTEALHITITALLVPVLAVLLGMPMASGEELVPITTQAALATFADPVIFLFFGGFALATALHIQKLDKKIAMWIISLSGGHLGVSVLAIFIVTALLSMWISNTATAAMMLPLALGLLAHLDVQHERKTFVFILLGIAYSASIGGLGTMVGSPPNAIAAKALDYDFADWMKIGLPMMLIILPAMLVSLYLVLRPKLNHKVQFITEDIPWTGTRIATMILFLCTATAWIFSKKLTENFGISQPDTWIAILAACMVVILGTATWKQISENTDWGVLYLFGGGLTLSAVLKDSGSSLVLGQTLANAFGDASPLLIIFVVATFIIFLTEFTSNTASAALLVPVFAAIAAQMGMPKEILVIVIGIGASCAFMLPVATPPNAIVFGTGHIQQSEMMKVGFVLNIMCIFLISLFIYWFFI
ncbi:DASS family sodium-coupled anion symporter [Acinetobacter bohemicus]|uniref:DASS family sodium-coupled anion symporter n=1 Tax=Acinetobacter lwoffii TaxID=28090 RepID=A0A9D2UUC9_ACILW|nr:MULTISPECIES: DASS family sodium-coupled anion symporter [unclassified Acinetobacter]MDM1780735.1 DASS family sodium-coupled anion symporter [Acinetobacter indicus]HJF28874.1 DASS family sodium-coupled anion symporter [Acinetobacter lwoffii]MCO8044846.1 DASS family sodium-coupled anion symporter [Acinetobacter sp. S4397-1]QKQ69031.1 DASS family sodium-coupled anion symporter [Acinetobacter sp. 10FS3-1]TQR61853.1 DASS family sodium-coupled anion symporter [Acinetobacter sp. RF14B]